MSTDRLPPDIAAILDATSYEDVELEKRLSRIVDVTVRAIRAGADVNFAEETMRWFVAQVVEREKGRRWAYEELDRALDIGLEIAAEAQRMRDLIGGDDGR